MDEQTLLDHALRHISNQRAGLVAQIEDIDRRTQRPDLLRQIQWLDEQTRQLLEDARTAQHKHGKTWPELVAAKLKD